VPSVGEWGGDAETEGTRNREKVPEEGREARDETPDREGGKGREEEDAARRQ
jgi:hypothetical protein